MLPFDTAIPIGTLPRNWEKALGYTSDTPARWLISYWMPGGDESMFEDGRLSATGSPWPYIDLVGNPHYSVPIARAVAASDGNGMSALGSSDNAATHCLLCDLETRALYVAPLAEARAFITPTLPDDYHPPTPEEQRAVGEVVRANLAAWRERVRTERAGKRLVLCGACVGGYLRAAGVGYDVCTSCGGAHARWEPVEGEASPAVPPCEDLDVLDWWDEAGAG